jgi:hypothetical protein
LAKYSPIKFATSFAFVWTTASLLAQHKIPDIHPVRSVQVNRTTGCLQLRRQFMSFLRRVVHAHNVSTCNIAKRTKPSKFDQHGPIAIPPHGHSSFKYDVGAGLGG